MDGQVAEILAGGGVVGMLVALAIWFVRKSGSLVFVQDNGGFRRDLLALLEQEREIHRQIKRELEDSRSEVNELTSEMMRLQVQVEAMRQQSALIAKMLQAVRSGALPVEELQLPDLSDVRGT